MKLLRPNILALAAMTSTAAAAFLPHRKSINTTTSGSAYSLIAEYSGSTFFDHFTAFSGPDPTRGHVQYQTLSDAADQGLVGFVHHTSSGEDIAHIGVDYKEVAPEGRKSVRLISKDTFEDGSMVVIDVRHAPSQYGVWPAIWLLGSEGTWPASGESDILEYVHEESHNAMTLHTSPNCIVDNVTSSAQQGRLVNPDCNAGSAAVGCSIKAYNENTLTLHADGHATPGGEYQQQKQSTTTSTTTTHTYSTAGSKFNSQGGSVYIHDWQPAGITIWSFPRTHLPADLLAGAPNPSTWTQTPLARFRGAGCDFTQAFRKMQLIINITFCGDWASRVWESSGARQATGYETCEEYVSGGDHLGEFEEAYFELGSARFYSNNGQQPGVGGEF